jgi:hypothetical protein
MTTRNKTIPYTTMLLWMKEILSEYREPLTVRQLYYQLVSRQKIGNSQTYYQKVSRDITTARESREIDPDTIEDRGRESSEGDYWKDRDASGFIQDLISSVKSQYYNYQYPKWINQPNYIEVWCEKQALQRIVSEIAGKYGVVSCVAKGFSSFTFVNDASRRFSNKICKGKTCKILYFGDFDPSGEDMVRDLIERIHRYGAEDVAIEKCALTKEQVIHYNLPSDPTKKTDPRAAKFVDRYGDICVELDSLRPDVLRSMIDAAIKSSINWDIWQKNHAEHELERTKIKTWCESMTVSVTGDAP